MKKFLALALALVMVLGLVACGTPAQKETTEAAQQAQTTAAAGETQGEEPQQEGEKVFRFSYTTEPNSLDPSMGNSIAENEIQYATQESLVRNIAGDVQAGLADKWEADETGKVWTFHIRDDAKWSDGQKITANDFEYSWKRLANPETGSGYAWILSFVKGADDVMYNGAALDTMGVKAIDESIFQVELAYVAPYFLSLIGSCGQFAPIRQDVVEQYGQEFAATGDKNVYSGPYTIASNEDLVVTFTPNEYYWNKDAISFDKAECYIVADSNTALAMYENEELDYCLIPAAQVANYTSDSRHNELVNGNTDWMYINNEDPQLSNKNLRLAMNYALDRNAYNTLANAGVYKPFNGAVCDIVAGLNGKYFSEMYTENRIFPIEGDQAKAQEYLAKAMEELGVSDPADIKLELTSTDNETTKKICEVVQNLLQTSLGITIEIRQVTYNEIYSTVFPNHDYQFGYGGWGPDYDDPYTYLELFYGPNANNYSGYKNAEYDALLDDAKVNPDEQARMDDLGKAEKIVLEDAVLLPLQMRTAHYLLDEDLTGINFYYGSVNLIWCYGDVQ